MCEKSCFLCDDSHCSYRVHVLDNDDYFDYGINGNGYSDDVVKFLHAILDPYGLDNDEKEN